MKYPFHIGVTEAGEGEDGRIRSAVGSGALLADGIGDTIRVSLTEDPAAEIPFARKLVLKTGILVTWILSGIKLTDTHNGFKAFSRKAARKIEIKQDRMAHASGILDEISRKKIRYKEVPVTVTYSSYSQKKGQSSLNSVRIGVKMIIRKLFG